MHKLLLPFTPRFVTFTLAIIAMLAIALVHGDDGCDRRSSGGSPFRRPAGLSALGVHDLLQERHAILRNYPIAAHLRFIFEAIRPEIRQYFIEGEKDGAPFSRDQRALVYQRAKGELDKRPFGTQLDVYADGYEWISHSIAPSAVDRTPISASPSAGRSARSPIRRRCSTSRR